MAPTVATAARLFGSRLTVLHVMDTASLGSDFAPFEGHFGTLREELMGKLEHYQADTFSGLAVDRVFKIGHPVDEIVSYARLEVADLIAMPTHGRSRFRELLLGSITSGVLHDTESCVLTAAHVEQSPVWNAPPRSILCAVDLSPFTVDVLNAAEVFAAKCNAALHVVYAMSTYAEGLAGGLPPLDVAIEEEKAQTRYIELAAQAETTTPMEIFHAATVANAVLAAEEQYKPDLLVIGRGKIQGVLGRLRTRAHELIRRSHCPVLSV